MRPCEHEYENANCENCANGLPHSAYECAKTQGRLKEYVHDKAEELHRQKFNEGYERGYEQGRADREKELSELPNEYSEKLWKIAYEKGRADERTRVIDEYKNRLKEEWLELDDDLSLSDDFYNFVDMVAEQLKE